MLIKAFQPPHEKCKFWIQNDSKNIAIAFKETLNITSIKINSKDQDNQSYNFCSSWDEFGNNHSYLHLLSTSKNLSQNNFKNPSYKKYLFLVTGVLCSNNWNIYRIQKNKTKRRRPKRPNMGGAQHFHFLKLIWSESVPYWI